VVPGTGGGEKREEGDTTMHDEKSPPSFRLHEKEGRTDACGGLAPRIEEGKKSDHRDVQGFAVRKTR